ncbi:hypothetical protein P12x_005263 [Tundrisphaera lichenicola]|uniref:hypothetical protein n=1 Tax=Tundrisphaera lichenicola TaxID=2029860 RepID=UPI003EBBBD08
MTADRILSQHGNVIAADFKPRPWWEELTVTIKCEWLYLDGIVGLLRVTTSFAGKPCGEPQHLFADLATGQIATL